jgi:hypothetical protein
LIEKVPIPAARGRLALDVEQLALDALDNLRAAAQPETRKGEVIGKRDGGDDASPKMPICLDARI